MIDLKLILSAIESFGIVGTLAFFVFAFLNGQIISRKMLDEIINNYDQKVDERIERMLKAIIAEIRSEIRKRSF